MGRDPKDGEARKLIEEFSAKLRRLNEGKKIPSAWKIATRKALDTAPAHGKPGKKIDYRKRLEVAKLLTEYGKSVSSPRTKNHNPGVYKRKIASATGVSEKTVARIMALMQKKTAAEVQLFAAASKDGLSKEDTKRLLELPPGLRPDLTAFYFDEFDDAALKGPNATEIMERLKAFKVKRLEHLTADYQRLKDDLHSIPPEEAPGHNES